MCGNFLYRLFWRRAVRVDQEKQEETVQSKTDENETKVEENGEAKKDTESAASGDAPTDIVQDSPGNESPNVAVLSEVQSPTQTSPITEESKCSEPDQTSAVVEAKIEAPCTESENKTEEKQTKNISLEKEETTEVKCSVEEVREAEKSVESKEAEEVKKISSPTEAQVTVPSETQVTTPIDTPASVPAERQAAAPVEKQAAAPAETQAAAPAETQAATPVETQAPAPVETQAAAPAETQAAAPAETQAAAPAEAQVAAPAEAQVAAPAEAQVAAPAEAQAAAPAEIQAAAPVETQTTNAIPEEKPVTPEEEITSSPVIENVQNNVDQVKEQSKETKSDDSVISVSSPVIEQPAMTISGIDEKPVEAKVVHEENKAVEESKPEVIENKITTTDDKENSEVQSPVLDGETPAEIVKSPVEKVSEETITSLSVDKAEPSEKIPTPNEEIAPVSPIAETPAVQNDSTNEIVENTETVLSTEKVQNEIAENQTNGIAENESQTNGIKINGTETNGPIEIPTLISWKKGGNQVSVTGDFNKWEDNCILNEQDGIFSTKLKLSKGTHHLKFLVDGNLTIDESLPVIELDGHGQVNVLTVQAE